MTTVALAAALAALVAVALVAVLVIRERRAADRRLAAGMREIGARMGALAADVAAANDRIEREALRARIVASLGQPLAADEVVARTAEAAAALPGVAGALVAVEANGRPLRAAAGMAAPTGADGTVGGPPDGSPVRAVAISYHYTARDAAAPHPQSAIAVPLAGAEGRHGFVTVFGRGEEPPVAGREFTLLEEIARESAAALERALARTRLPAAEHSARSPGRRRLHETLVHEIAAAQRAGGRLALCIVAVADGGRLDPETAADAVVQAVEIAAGASPLAFRIGTGDVAVVLRGAGRVDAEALCARLHAEVDPGPRAASGGRVRLVHGVAELHADDDAVSLLARAESDLRRRGHGTAA